MFCSEFTTKVFPDADAESLQVKALDTQVEGLTMEDSQTPQAEPLDSRMHLVGATVGVACGLAQDVMSCSKLVGEGALLGLVSMLRRGPAVSSWMRALIVACLHGCVQDHANLRPMIRANVAECVAMDVQLVSELLHVCSDSRGGWSCLECDHVGRPWYSEVYQGM